MAISAHSLTLLCVPCLLLVFLLCVFVSSPQPNQDPLTELVPLLGFDVWEHAYYYLYGPARAEYIKKIWDIVNWKNVSERYAAAKKA